MTIAVGSMTGCVTVRESRIPEFILNLESFQFTDEEREVIGDILNYVNDLENEK